jgi:hypothetical protein
MPDIYNYKIVPGIKGYYHRLLSLVAIQYNRFVCNVIR